MAVLFLNLRISFITIQFVESDVNTSLDKGELTAHETSTERVSRDSNSRLQNTKHKLFDFNCLIIWQLRDLYHF